MGNVDSIDVSDKRVNGNSFFDSIVKHPPETENILNLTGNVVFEESYCATDRVTSHKMNIGLNEEIIITKLDLDNESMIPNVFF